MMQSNDTLTQLFYTIGDQLMDERNRLDYNRNNLTVFPSAPGVYAVFFENELIYIGETSDLNLRMKDLKNTYNHTLRKKLGKLFFPTEEIAIRKFPELIENRLNQIFQHCISVAFVTVNLGRTEIEAHLISRFPNLLNSPSLRGH